MEVEEEEEGEAEGTKKTSVVHLSLFSFSPSVVLLPGKQVQVAAHEDERVELLRPEGDACFLRVARKERKGEIDGHRHWAIEKRCFSFFSKSFAASSMTAAFPDSFSYLGTTASPGS